MVNCKSSIDYNLKRAKMRKTSQFANLISKIKIVRLDYFRSESIEPRGKRVTMKT
jgi:hypothetical protein